MLDSLQPWHDTELKAGDRWDKEIQTNVCLYFQHGKQPFGKGAKGRVLQGESNPI